MHTYKLLIFVLVLAIGPSALAAGKSQLIPVGQGISSPNSTSFLNFSHGYTHVSPVGALYLDGMRLSLHYDTGDSGGTTNSGYGLEGGVGNGNYGAALSYYTRENCSACDKDITGAIAGIFWGVGLGLRFEEEVLSAGFLFNPTGDHRVGVTAELNNPEGDNNNIQSIGAGYSYVNTQYTFSIDASKRTFENTASKDDTILLTPGLAMHFQSVSVSVNYDMYLKDPDSSTQYDNKIWWGLGFGRENSWYASIHGDYFNELSAAVSFFF